MGKIIVLIALAVIGWRMLTGRWPWEKRLSPRDRALLRARTLLGVSPNADRQEIAAAHKRLVALIHPDKGGSSHQVHEANAARDLLYDDLPRRVG
ncbi:J domain-containing protein [Aurantiacibacter spongiae]|uniref:J domain-containing protein n=1 Tax=Aurantiacibacter spongiae TaxID=2488860 RepID=A0A3N5CXC1_9SPHN|nr:J domain-containing protein [Aurantiacibacter spongiae]RPF71299.1 J domain-containing protein [Aurantiacibacter spongiae]